MCIYIYCTFEGVRAHAPFTEKNHLCASLAPGNDLGKLSRERERRKRNQLLFTERESEFPSYFIYIYIYTNRYNESIVKFKFRGNFTERKFYGELKK